MPGLYVAVLLALLVAGGLAALVVRARRRATGVEVEVATEGGTFRPGEQVRFTVRVAGRRDRPVAGAHVELCYVNRYRVETPDGPPERGAERVTVATGPLLDSEILPRSLEHRGALRVPAGAPPTAHGEVTSVEWRVRAAVRLSDRLETEGTAGFTVVAPPRPDAPPPKPVGEPARGLDLRLTTDQVPAGGTIEGTLDVAPEQDLAVRGVRVDLVCREDGGVMAHGTTTTVGTVRAAGPVLLVAGDPRAFPFAVAVPAGAPPSYEAEATHLRWFVRATLERKGRGDPSASRGVVVTNG